MNAINPARNNVQIATFGEDCEGIKIGLQNFPTSKLFLVCYDCDDARALEYSRMVADILKIDTSCVTVKKKFCLFEVLEKIGQIAEGELMSKILVNVSNGDKLIASAAICASFVYGLHAFSTNTQGGLEILPPIKLSYTRIVSDAKMKVLKVLYQNGGSVESLDRLSEFSKLGKALISYHIHGIGNEGLINNGFVEVVKIKNKKLIKLTDFGMLFISQNGLSESKVTHKEFKNRCECCGCIPEECTRSGNERECPYCILEKCCCWSKFAPLPIISK